MPPDVADGDTDQIMAVATTLTIQYLNGELGQPVDFGAGVRAAQKVFAER